MLERGISESLVRRIVREPEQIIGHGIHKVFQSRMTRRRQTKEYLVRIFAEVHRDVVIGQCIGPQRSTNIGEPNDSGEL